MSKRPAELAPWEEPVHFQRFLRDTITKAKLPALIEAVELRYYWDLQPIKPPTLKLRAGYWTKTSMLEAINERIQRQTTRQTAIAPAKEDARPSTNHDVDADDDDYVSIIVVHLIVCSWSPRSLSTAKQSRLSSCER